MTSSPTATNPCGTGGGTIKPGYERAVYIGAASVEALAAEFGTPATAAILAPIIAAGTYDLLHICTNGDPGDPVLTVQDLVYALNPYDFVNSGAAWQRIQQWFVHMMWPTWCDCANGTIPPPATSAPLPAGGVNSGLPAGPSTKPCWQVQQTFTTPTNAVPVDVTDALMPSGTPLAVSGCFTGQPTHAPTMPSGVTHVTVQYAGDALPSDNAHSYNLIGCTFGPTGVSNGPQLVIDISIGAPTSGTAVFALPTNTAAMLWSLNGNEQHQLAVNLSFLCAGQDPNGVSTPCCPPDPLLDQKLTSIVQMLQVLGNHLVVGNASLVSSTVHAGLSGAGTITLVHACAAIRVNVTSSLTNWPANPGSPTYYLSLGFITSVAVGAPLKGWRLVYQSQTYPLAPYADQIGYTLPPGVTIDIIEELAGP